MNDNDKAQYQIILDGSSLSLFHFTDYSHHHGKYTVESCRVAVLHAPRVAQLPFGAARRVRTNSARAAKVVGAEAAWQWTGEAWRA